MVKFWFLGGADEVGREAIYLDLGQEKFLLDYGVNVQTMSHPIEAPLPLKAIFLSHAHLDHSGHLPCLYRRGCEARTFATPVTFDLSLILLKDSIKVQRKKGMIPHYSYQDIDKLFEHASPLYYRQKVGFDQATFEFRDAGHIPGSASILIHAEKRILFTGDIKFEPTRLLNGADQDLEADILITEATYSYKNHPERESLTRKLQEEIRTAVEAGGIVLLPCFAVGRTQEMLVIVEELGLPYWVDGMGIHATQAILRHPESHKDPVRLQRAFDSARKIRKAKDRFEAISKPGVILASAGMLQGGPIQWYLKRLHDREECLLILNGYQIEGTPGRILLETGRIQIPGLDVKPKMRVEFMDFSQHCGRDNLISFMEKLNPETIILVHGDRNHEFREELAEKGWKVFSPKNGDKLEL